MAQMMMKSDSELQQDVLRELRWDTRVDETEVGVQVKDRIVTLAGTVSSWGKRVAAEQAAHRVAGVLDVANDLEVAHGEQSDADIARVVRHALQWDVLVPHEKITSTVASGMVTLAGKVDYGFQRDDASRAIRNLAGVRGVINLIEVAASKVPPERVRSAIEDALKRHATREASRVDLAIHDGRVVLRGSVGSWQESQAIAGAVRGTAGVTVVENNLRIEPYAF